MATIELPHTHNCLVCGRGNPHGLHLSLHVDADPGVVRTSFTTRPYDVGFEGVVHGGLLATVADEAMVWSAIWASARSCVAGEMTVRYKQKVVVGETLVVTARPTRVRSKLIEAEAEIRNAAGEVVAAASGKFVALSREVSAAFYGTLVREPATEPALALLLKRGEQLKVAPR